jgi:hypothetical protein
VKGRLLLDVVVAEGTAILKLLAGKDQALLVGRDTTSRQDDKLACGRRHRPVQRAPLLVLDLRLHIVDGVRRLHLKGDRLPRKGLDENLHGGGGGCRSRKCVRQCPLTVQFALTCVRLCGGVTIRFLLPALSLSTPSSFDFCYALSVSGLLMM